MTDTVAEPRPALRPDRFQREAMAVIDSGRSVLVAAPTGAGKTMIAEHAIEVALAAGRKAFYTTPIKALSNQKYRDFAARWGSDRVGLLTGDNSVNGDAPVVVMTTEVLRNMIYADAATLRDLGWVVLDEVHYLQDSYRGPVWEEVIIHAPADIRFVCLSATVSNLDELAGWMRTVRGETETVVERQRPVELASLYAVGDADTDRVDVSPLFVSGRMNKHLTRFDVDPRPRRGRRRRRWFTPRRLSVVEELNRRKLLPAIHFVFSRAGCDDAMSEVYRSGLRLTDDDERDRIVAIIESKVATLTDVDLDVLGYSRWLSSLEAGIAAHHAGMVPAFKEAVEACFVEGLVKIVYATETLALGINMPARSVVLDKLTKFNGETHELLTPLEYTQLTGRAGRRGIDDEGFALVLWSPFIASGEVAAVAGSTSFPLRSAFRPTYNMAANLVGRYDRDTAHRMLNLSFAQYQGNREVVDLELRIRRRRGERDELQDQAVCKRGDVGAWFAANRRRPAPTNDSRNEQLSVLRPGDIIAVPGEEQLRAAVLSVAFRKGGDVRVRAVTGSDTLLELVAADFDDRPETLGAISLPEPYAPQKPAYQREVADQLRRTRLRRRRPRAERAVDDAESADPVVTCPRFDDHLDALRRIERLDRTIDHLERRAETHTETLARQFAGLVEILESRGYLDGWSLTDAGQRLAGLYHELDLLIAEALTEGLFDGLDAPSVAALASCVTYEARPTDAPADRLPTGTLRERARALARLADGLMSDEESSRAGAATRPPDTGFGTVAYRWAAGEDLDRALGHDLSGGDFVRNAKQLVDLLRQIADVAPLASTGRTARQAADGIFRGVVAASSAIGAVDASPEISTDEGEPSDGQTAPRR